MKIYLTRHGETTGDVDDRYGGDYDDHLSEKGKQDAKLLAEKLKGKGIQVIYHSTRIRAAETAKIVNDVLNLKLEPVNDLKERNNYGILTGMVKSEAKQRHPSEFEKLAGGNFRHGVTGSEDYDSFKERVINAINKILKCQNFPSSL